MSSIPNVQPVETRIRVLPEWIDVNGHMNVAYYVLAFDRATDVLYEALGCAGDYVARQRSSVFTLAMNVDYVREVFAGDEVRIESRILDHDHKRIHYFHQMYHAGDGWLAATNECMVMHIDMTTRRSAPFPGPVAERLAAMAAAHQALGRPERVGRSLEIRRGKPDQVR